MKQRIRKNKTKERLDEIDIRGKSIDTSHLLVSIIMGFIIIPILKKRKVGQIERDDGPQSHLKKQGTPTMGGIIIIITMTLVVIGTYIYLSNIGETDIAHRLITTYCY